MAYNSTHSKYKSTWLAGLDCQTTGAIKGNRADFGDKMYATWTVPTGEQLEVGDCVLMLRIPAGTTVVGGRLSWTALGAAQIALGDPFACARFLGAILTTTANDLAGGNANVAGLDCGVIRKIGTTGDGCGIGYTYTCETDICVTNLYAEGNASVGGWVGSTAANYGTAGGAITGGTIRLVLDVLPV